MDFHVYPVSFHCHFFFLVCSVIQFDELSFFLVVVYWSDECAYEYGKQNSKPFDPSFGSVFRIGSSDFEGDG